MKWAIYSERDSEGDIIRGHVFPVNDDGSFIGGKEHMDEEDCWCKPEIDRVNSIFIPIVVHRAPS